MPSVFVETLDKCFKNVCELDLVFNYCKVCISLNSENKCYADFLYYGLDKQYQMSAWAYVDFLCYLLEVFFDGVNGFSLWFILLAL
jgi:hypothetical protein